MLPSISSVSLASERENPSIARTSRPASSILSPALHSDFSQYSTIEGTDTQGTDTDTRSRGLNDADKILMSAGQKEDHRKRGLASLSALQQAAARQMHIPILYICLFVEAFPDVEHLKKAWKGTVRPKFPNIKLEEDTLAYVS